LWTGASDENRSRIKGAGKYLSKKKIWGKFDRFELLKEVSRAVALFAFWFLLLLVELA
jgi:hypothetical protein